MHILLRTEIPCRPYTQPRSPTAIKKSNYGFTIVYKNMSSPWTDWKRKPFLIRLESAAAHDASTVKIGAPKLLSVCAIAISPPPAPAQRSSTTSAVGAGVRALRPIAKFPATTAAARATTAADMTMRRFMGPLLLQRADSPLL